MNLSSGMEAKTETGRRNYGIDLLRLVLMYMVCLLHTLGQGGILSASPAGTVRYGAFWFLEIAAYCAVDGFALISGYTASEKKPNSAKIVSLWFAALFYSCVLTLLLAALGVRTGLTAKGVVKLFLPVTFSYYWYFTAYFALFFAMPLLNASLFALEQAAAKKALLIIAALYSVLGVLYDPFLTNGGYSALWLMVLYCIGVLMRRIRLFDDAKTSTLLLLWLLCLGVTWFFKVFLGSKRLVSYISPTILLAAIIMVVLFSRLKPSPRAVGKLSPLAFGIYLFHLNRVIWAWLQNAFVSVAALPAPLGVISALGVAGGIFVSGLAAEFLRTRLFRLLRIEKLSEGIAALAGRLLEKCAVLLR